ncbi:MAG: glucosamine-6-phosphate deaminase [Planctomycetaceae bacterium]|nr:glucosamine-6-phosphate deaminase [Planctomycetaceae bacterium]|tara:strand:+ start:4446 stop:5180 length:735 start_codon:yes stop_codon:yes gene_type:complete
MNIVICNDYQHMSAIAAQVFINCLQANTQAVLGLATGSTPVGVYQQLIESYKAGEISFAEVTSFNLDEYIGLHRDHPQSYYYFMHQELLNHINIEGQRVFIPSGIEENYGAYCQWYEDQISQAGGIDLQILGIGSDGHIAFNEPGTALGSRTHITELDHQTIDDNARFFEAKADVPRRAITMGVATIMEAREIILLATGENKARAIRDALEGPVSSQCTASALQQHSNVTFYLDSAAASLLQQK